MWILLRQHDFLSYDVECARLACRLILELFNFEPRHTLISSVASTNDKIKIYPALNPLASRPNQRFYYSEWKEEINEELVETRFDWMRLLGPNIRYGALFKRLVSICKESLRANVDPSKYRCWSEIIRSSLFPSLLISDENERNHAILWHLLSGLPLEDRYCLYASWTFDQVGNPALVNLLQKSTRMVVKSLTRRITSDNAHTIASLFRSEILRCPGMGFLEILKPVMRYGQFAQYVKVFSSLTELGVDVFGFVVSGLLKNPEHHGVIQSERLKDDCTNVTGWLRNLAHFNSLLCLEYDFFDINLAHVVSQLQEGNHYDLVFLSELLSNLGGLVSHGTPTSIEDDDVFNPMACSQSTSSHATATKLAAALADSSLFTALLVLLAQQEQSVIFSIDINPCTSDTRNPPIEVSGLSSKFIQANRIALTSPKVLANHIDAIHDVLLRLVELISRHINPEKLRDLVPSLSELCKGYGIDSSLAFSLLRPWLNFLAAHDTREVGSDNAIEPRVSLQEVKSDPAPEETWLPSLQPIILEFQQLFPSATSKGIRSEFYITFWQLQMDDVYVPSSRYKHKISQHKKMLKDERTYERRGILTHHIKLLKQDHSSHISLYNSCLKRINREKEHWFAATIDPKSLATQLVENCILQRSPISRRDALFCAKFLAILHRESTPHFSLILVIDAVLEHLPKMLFLLTEAEARHFGAFLTEVFSYFTHWNANFAAFSSEASSLLSSSHTSTFHAASDLHELYGLLPQDVFRLQLLSWSNQILDIALQCLNSRECMQIHSTIFVLAEMEEIFPITTIQYSALLDPIQALVIDKQVNLCSLALSYKAKLIKLHPRCVPATTFAPIPDPPFRQPPPDNEDEIVI
ncbi:THO2 plays a role in transcriptional elongation [Entomophthora muscae]|uniref:THO2 plays a role in transcriptional elongation n=1 Tax=Entomophthora muscae TaxID=34485 RepID=A0ACC2RH23_9FUNG|nr:THO2 plays a role in transcriptional elongation [Entomophthora muscae]